jgi:hypothetical protein
MWQARMEGGSCREILVLGPPVSAGGETHLHLRVARVVPFNPATPRLMWPNLEKNSENASRGKLQFLSR